ncbi:hypothetical protein Tco_0927389 [Tanacetum coccineum]|uniref:Uncharacterized protein n=1 Tax=Tanacetum coccineum TaxID=301880 RepID=A0ABQ5G4P5_9ASTR
MTHLSAPSALLQRPSTTCVQIALVGQDCGKQTVQTGRLYFGEDRFACGSDLAGGLCCGYTGRELRGCWLKVFEKWHTLQWGVGLISHDVRTGYFIVYLGGGWSTIGLVIGDWSGQTEHEWGDKSGGHILVGGAHALHTQWDYTGAVGHFICGDLTRALCIVVAIGGVDRWMLLGLINMVSGLYSEYGWVDCAIVLGMGVDWFTTGESEGIASLVDSWAVGIDMGHIIEGVWIDHGTLLFMWWQGIRIWAVYKRMWSRSQRVFDFGTHAESQLNGSCSQGLVLFGLRVESWQCGLVGGHDTESNTWACARKLKHSQLSSHRQHTGSWRLGWLEIRALGELIGVLALYGGVVTCAFETLTGMGVGHDKTGCGDTGGDMLMFRACRTVTCACGWDWSHGWVADTVQTDTLNGGVYM